MQPAEHNITIYRGDNFELFVRLREKTWNAATNTFIPGAYLDLTGQTGKAQLRQDEDSTTVAAEFTVDLGNQSTTPGSAYIRLTATQTAGLTITSGKYDLQFTVGGETLTYLRGNVTITKDVTRQ
jgi:hypothetical protein